MSTTLVRQVRNVNDALRQLIRTDFSKGWRVISPRGMKTLEHDGPVITEYLLPTERVLFSAHRDANPYFHLVESLWIIAGCRSAKPLVHYNKNMANYTDAEMVDDSTVFHGAYGYRLRSHFAQPYTGDRIDQISIVIDLLREKPDTRQAVLTIWDPSVDLGTYSNDIPCNDMVMLKVRDGELHITVCCRSNDAIWGAYGANAVQFSMLQEYIAGAIGVKVGRYRQVSDSFHIYDDNVAWDRLCRAELLNKKTTVWDYYKAGMVKPFPMYECGGSEEARVLAGDCHRLMSWIVEEKKSFENTEYRTQYFRRVVEPIVRSYEYYKLGDYRNAYYALSECEASDWREACSTWLSNRQGGIPDAL